MTRLLHQTQKSLFYSIFDYGSDNLTFVYLQYYTMSAQGGENLHYYTISALGGEGVVETVHGGKSCSQILTLSQSTVLKNGCPVMSPNPVCGWHPNRSAGFYNGK